MDQLTPDQRSRQMALIRSAHTTPEIVVRQLVHRHGFRYRLHVKTLPGCPDLVFPTRRKVIFVHGCFWHWHRCKRGRRMPKTHADYWRVKITRNMTRDAAQRRKLRRLGWEVMTVWECETATHRLPLLTSRLLDFLGSD